MSLDEELPLEVSRKIDELCLQFERELQANEAESLESYLKRWNDSAKFLPYFFEELLRVELEVRIASQDTLVIGQYATRFPEYLENVEQVFAEIASGEADYELSPQPENTKPIQENQPPQCIGRYQVQTLLGEGSFGVVYRAYDPELDCFVAIKELKITRILTDSANQEKRAAIVQNLLRESRLAAKLRQYEGIVAILDVITLADDQAINAIYCVQEFIDGGDLKQRLKEGPISPTETAHILQKVAQAMGKVHEQGIYHRDLKPANLILDAQGNPYVTDFGLAIDAHLQQQLRGEIAGTLEYMAPEQLRGEVHLFDGRTDIWALGVIFYEMLTGERPFRQSTFLEAQQEICHREPKPPRSSSPHLPKELERICLKSLSKRMTDRYATAYELSADLRAWLERIQQGDDAFSSESVLARVRPKGLRSFDEEDADFFPRLLPGPRDRLGLPDSLGFWKRKIEEKDPEKTFRIGLLYGPSGSGKSSFLKAGLLPRLNQIVPVFVEATANDTEARLVRQLRKVAPGLQSDLSLPEIMVSLRESPQLTGFKKIVLILDQFEQWLQSRRAYGREQLIEALRQCDGHRVQTLILIRDDFWMAVTRFMQELEVDMIPGENTASIDLFPTDHARRVLSELGRGYGKLPEEGEPTTLQRLFLEKVVSGLAVDGKVVCVRLAIFAEMVKTKEWTPATIDAVGGTSGVGERFLEESFHADSASPSHRRHVKAASSVLQQLLPEVGTNIKGYMKSREELLAASGYEDSPENFSELIKILDGELRLITPTDPDGLLENVDRKSDTNYYQLTHDYLVRPLRDWLTRHQRSTKKGRAQLLLSELANTWTAKPEPRNLPSPMEWLSIIRWTRRSERTAAQQLMVTKSTNRLIRNSVLTVGIVMLLIFGSYQWNGAVQSAAAVDQLMAADTSELPDIMPAIIEYASWTKPMLLREFSRMHADPKSESRDDAEKTMRTKTHLALANTILNPENVSQILERVPEVPVEHLLVIRQLLKPQAEEVADEVWDRFHELTDNEGETKLRYTAILAGLSPSDARWADHRRDLTDRLLSIRIGDSAYWRTLFRPLKADLAPALIDQLSVDQTFSADQRSILLDLISSYASDTPELLVKAIEFAETEELGPLLDQLDRYPDEGLKLVRARLASLDPEPLEIDPVSILGAEVARRVEAADGIVARESVMVQHVPRQEFDALDDQLESLGFTANCVRPYFDADEMYVAAVWIKAPAPELADSKIFWDLSLEEVKQLQEQMEKDGGYKPVDFALYQSAVSMQERQPPAEFTLLGPLKAPKPPEFLSQQKWVVVWRPSSKHDREVRFLPDSNPSDYKKYAEEWPDEGFYLSRFYAWQDSFNDIWVSMIWEKTEQFIEKSYTDMRFRRAFGDLVPGLFQPDIRRVNIPSGESNYSVMYDYLSDAEYEASQSQESRERDIKLLSVAKYFSSMGKTEKALPIYKELKARWFKISSAFHEEFADCCARAEDLGAFQEHARIYSLFRNTLKPEVRTFLKFRGAVLEKDSTRAKKELEQLQIEAESSDRRRELLARAYALLASLEWDPEQSRSLISQCVDHLSEVIRSGETDAPGNLVFNVDFDAVRESDPFQQLVTKFGFDQIYQTTNYSSLRYDSRLLRSDDTIKEKQRFQSLISQGYTPWLVEVGLNDERRQLDSVSVFKREIPALSGQIANARSCTNLIIAACGMGDRRAIMTALSEDQRPDLYNQLILHSARLIPLGTVMEMLQAAVVPEQEHALLLILGDYDQKVIGPRVRDSLMHNIHPFLSHNDPGVRSAARWCCQKWGLSDGDAVKDLQNEFQNSVGQRMLCLRPTKQVLIGSPSWEVGRRDQETRRWLQFKRNYALAEGETTVAEFRQFLDDEKVRKYYGTGIDRFRVYSRSEIVDDQAPVTGVSWRDAALYCQWLSEQDQTIAKDEYCYPTIWEGENKKLRLSADYRLRTGYRLPTEAEWEYAARAGELEAQRFTGNDPRLMDGFIWSGRNSQGRTHPVRQLRPNRYGFFDLLGNVSEWCDGMHHSYGLRPDQTTLDDTRGNPYLPIESDWCALRGGTYQKPEEELRSAARDFQLAKYYSSSFGFRVARTLPD